MLFQFNPFSVSMNYHLEEIAADAKICKSLTSIWRKIMVKSKKNILLRLFGTKLQNWFKRNITMSSTAIYLVVDHLKLLKMQEVKKRNVDDSGKLTRWLTSNSLNWRRCPVRLYKLLLEKRTENVTCPRFFFLHLIYFVKNRVLGPKIHQFGRMCCPNNWKSQLIQ